MTHEENNLPRIYVIWTFRSSELLVKSDQFAVIAEKAVPHSFVPVAITVLCVPEI